MLFIRLQKTPYIFFFFLLSVSVSANNLSWQRPYIGIYSGGAFANNDSSTNVSSSMSTAYFTSGNDIAAVNNAGTWTSKPNAGIIGLQAGHDWVRKEIVYGGVLDYSALLFNSSRRIDTTYPTSAERYSIYTSMNTDWLFTLRGKLGYQRILRFPSLFYVTGGMAMTRLKVSNDFNDNSSLAGMGSSDVSQNQIGWTAGAGVEVAAFKQVSLNIEYLYVDFPAISTMGAVSNTQGGFGIPVQSLTSPLYTTANLHTDIVKIGLNYRFDE